MSETYEIPNALIGKIEIVESWPFDTPHWYCTLVPDRYGYVKLHKGNRSVIGSRYIYELLRGPIPDGMFIDHLCHTYDIGCSGGVEDIHRRCLNPWHMEPVSRSENRRRMTISYRRQLLEERYGVQYILPTSIRARRVPGITLVAA